MILLSDALSIMSELDPRGNPVPFSIMFTQADLKRGTGGEDIVMEDAIMITQPRRRLLGRPSSPDVQHIRNARGRQNHWLHGTRNIKRVTDDLVTKVHIRLIKKVNGHRVVWNIHG